MFSRKALSDDGREVLGALWDRKPHYVEFERRRVGGIFEDCARAQEAISELFEKGYIDYVDWITPYPIVITERGLDVLRGKYKEKN